MTPMPPYPWTLCSAERRRPAKRQLPNEIGRDKNRFGRNNVLRNRGLLFRCSLAATRWVAPASSPINFLNLCALVSATARERERERTTGRKLSVGKQYIYIYTYMYIYIYTYIYIYIYIYCILSSCLICTFLVDSQLDQCSQGNPTSLNLCVEG